MASPSPCERHAMEAKMKRTGIALLFTAAFCGAAQAATCLAFRDIQSSDSPDGKSLLLTMRNGKNWARIVLLVRPSGLFGRRDVTRV